MKNSHQSQESTTNRTGLVEPINKGAVGRQKSLLAGREQLRRLIEGLQTCRGLREAQQVLANELPRLLSLPGGALAVQDASRVYLEVVHSWGPGAGTRSQAVFVPEDCHGLQRGRPAWCLHPAREPCCRHLEGAEPAVPTVCYPLTAHNQILGSLMLWGDELARFDAEAQDLLEFTAEILSLVLSNLQLQEALRYQGVMDPLTGLYNRRHMEATLERELARAKRNGEPLALLMLDIDHFKQYNDTHGHDAADAVLAGVARLLSSYSRAEDVACRYDGEAFLIVMSGLEHENALARAEQLRARVKTLQPRFHGEQLPGVSVSLGVSMYPEHGETTDALVRRADRALYQAKRQGRNRVQVAGEVTGE